MRTRKTEDLSSGRASVWLVVAALALVGAAVASSACGTPESSSLSSTVSATSVTGAAVAGPFTVADLSGLVLLEAEGNGLIEGLLHRPVYSGTSQLADVRGWTLVPPERLQAVGFAGCYASVFFTDEFHDDFGNSGRSLVTAALLFETPEGAMAALRVFADSRDELWEEWQGLSSVLGANSIAQTGRCGSDSDTEIHPTIGFGMQVANVYLLIGSQGGHEFDEPLAEDIMRSITEKLLSRAQARLAEIQD